MKKLAHGSARRSFVSVILALAATLGACAPLPKSHDASSAGGGGGGGASARAGWVTEAHEENPTIAREAPSDRAPRTERVDLRPPRTGVVYCTRCQ